MKSQTSRMLLLCLGVLCFGVCGLQAENAYNAIEIDIGSTLNRSFFSADINNSGQAVMCTAGSKQCYVYDNGQLTTLSFPTSISSVKINDHGDILAGTEEYKYYLHSNGVTETLNFAVQGMNNHGAMVGYTYDSSIDHIVSAVYQDGVMTTIPGTTWACGINNNNDIVGLKPDSQYIHIGYRYSGGVLTDLPTTGYTYYISANRINDKGQILGIGMYDLYHNQSFFYENGQMQMMGLLPGTVESIGMDLNNHGQVIGSSGSHDYFGKAFVFENGIMQDLTAMINLPGGYIFNDPRAINDNGWIIGRAQDPDHWYQGKAYLLTPIPEPATLLLFGLGGLMLRRKK